jgi:hypothetical protein
MEITLNKGQQGRIKQVVLECSLHGDRVIDIPDDYIGEPLALACIDCVMDEIKAKGNSV